MEYYHSCYSALLNSINCNAATICGGEVLQLAAWFEPLGAAGLQ